MKNEIRSLIAEILKEMNVSADFIVETPADISNGDYSTNVALALSKELSDNPNSIADQLIKRIADSRQPTAHSFKKIEKAGPGFINFYLSDEVIQQKISNPKLLSDKLKDQKILVEFTDPNLFKQFHIGHLMSNTIGESLGRIFEAGGAHIERICYTSDVGPNIAKAVWGMIQHKAFFPQDQDLLEDKIKFLNESYVFGNLQFKENEKAEREINQINKELFENPSIDLQTYYLKGKKWSLEHFNEMYKVLGTKFDKFYFESETANKGKKLVEQNIGNVFEKSDGAIVYRGEKKGLHTRVFINSKGLPTYESKDLGLALMKSENFDFDSSIIITGNEQQEYFKVMLSALNDIYPEISSKTKSITHGLMKIGGKKTSSREGKSVTAEDLIHQVRDLVSEKIKNRELSEAEQEDLKNKISISAIKYSILKQAIGRDIEFDFDKSISFEGDSGPYVQYAFTRAKSILDKRTANSERREEIRDWKTTDLERVLIQFEDVLENSLEELAPQYIVTYATKLASEFNSFYANNKILDEEDKNMGYKLQITKAVKDTLEKSLNILGIEVPSKM